MWVMTPYSFILFVSTYSPINPELFLTILRNNYIIKQVERMRSTLDLSHIIKSKRQSWNLKKLLTRANFETLRRREHPLMSKCNRLFLSRKWIVMNET